MEPSISQQGQRRGPGLGLDSAWTRGTSGMRPGFYGSPEVLRLCRLDPTAVADARQTCVGAGPVSPVQAFALLRRRQESSWEAENGGNSEHAHFLSEGPNKA